VDETSSVRAPPPLTLPRLKRRGQLPPPERRSGSAGKRARRGLAHGWPWRGTPPRGSPDDGATGHHGGGYVPELSTLSHVITGPPAMGQRTPALLEGSPEGPSSVGNADSGVPTSPRTRWELPKRDAWVPAQATVAGFGPTGWPEGAAGPRRTRRCRLRRASQTWLFAQCPRRWRGPGGAPAPRDRPHRHGKLPTRRGISWAAVAPGPATGGGGAWGFRRGYDRRGVGGGGLRGPARSPDRHAPPALPPPLPRRRPPHISCEQLPVGRTATTHTVLR
jgi:hypothetical protein